MFNTQRLWDSIVPISSWIIITMPLWLSPFYPTFVSYFILAFDLYFFYKTIATVYYASLSYSLIQKHKKIRFDKKVLKIKKTQEIKHFIIIPTFKEPLSKLRETIQAIASSNYPYKQNINLVLAFEAREKGASKKAKILNKEFKDKFNQIKVFYHQLQPHEVIGKASNQAYAAKELEKEIKSRKENIIITICDSDSVLPKNYLSYLTYAFLRDKGRKYHFYWGAVLLYNNFWKLPLFVRIQATLSSLLRLAFLSQKEKLIQISTYSTNLWLLNKVGFWDTNIIPEDWHIFLQAFFKFGEKVKTIPLYTIINADAVYTKNLIRTFKNRYDQERRWAWGVTDISYALKQSFKKSKISIWAKLKILRILIETHLFWSISFFILTLSASIPPLINPNFRHTVIGFLLPQLSSIILTLSSLVLIIYIYLDISLRKNLKIYTKPQAVPILILQWYLLPLISFVLSSLPALDAHTRLLVGKKIKYKVTEKE